jgi:hypothetical protein
VSPQDPDIDYGMIEFPLTQPPPVPNLVRYALSGYISDAEINSILSYLVSLARMFNPVVIVSGGIAQAEK